MVAASVIATVAAGLFYTLDVETGSPMWIGYEVLAGIGYGMGLQVPLILSQAKANPADMASVTATVLFFHTIGAPFLINAAQVGFANTIRKRLATSAPGVPVDVVIAIGATDLRNAFPNDIHGVLVAYMASVQVAFGIALCSIGLATVFSLLLSWDNLGTKRIKESGGAA